MLTFADIIMLEDLLRLPNDVQKDLCTNLDLSVDGTSDVRAERIWEKIRNDRQARSRVVEHCGQLLWGGKTSISWFDSMQGIKGVKELIERNDGRGFNPFETMRIPHATELSTEPKLFCAVQGEKEGEYFLRYMYKTGVSRSVFGGQVQRFPKSAVTTVFVDENNGFIEVRTNPDASKKIIKSLGSLIQQQVNLEQREIMAPFGNNVEEIADLLDGELTDTVSRPEELLEGFTREQAIAVVEILKALDQYFKDGEIASLEESLNFAKEDLGEDGAATPFTVLILNGLEKVGLGADDELRGKVLYDYLNPHLQHQGGHIRFKLAENGVVNSYTVRVGIYSNSFYFVSPATEAAINFVREKIVK